MRIKNQGFLLKKDELACIFERGFRSREAKNRYPAGTGFGLYIAKRIIEIHEGNISAQIEEDYNVFIVTLPVKALEGKA